MNKKIEDILAKLPDKEMMAQWPQAAVNAVEALKTCVLSEQLEKKVLKKQLYDIRDAIYALQCKLNTNIQQIGEADDEDIAEFDDAEDNDDDRYWESRQRNALLDKGKQNGFLTYEEVDRVASTAHMRIEDLLEFLKIMDIAVVGAEYKPPMRRAVRLTPMNETPDSVACDTADWDGCYALHDANGYMREASPASESTGACGKSAAEMLIEKEAGFATGTALPNKDAEADSPKQERPKSWDMYEAAFLLKYYLKVEAGEMQRADAVATVSKSLRQRAMAQGFKITEKFRNINGISIMMNSIRDCYLEKAPSFASPSKIFREVVSLYKKDHTSLDRILLEF